MDRLELARDAYRAYESGDRSVMERLLAPGFTFYSPADVGIDRDAYFERCWPNADHIRSYEFTRMLEQGDEVVVTYAATRTDDSRFCNTEVLTFEGDQMVKTEVYFGWNLTNV